MKNFLALILAFFAGGTKAAPDPNQLGSDADLIRVGLFAAEPMRELMARSRLSGEPGAFQSIADAVQLVDAGKKAEAVVKLQSALSFPNLETREHLWLWSALREHGEKPDAKSAFEVLGIVAEVPMEGGYDSLAAYQDGSARYLNFSGKGIFWDMREDAVVAGLCQAFIDAGVAVSSTAVPRTTTALPKHGVQLTLLTRAGNFVVTDPPVATVNTGAALMIELMKRARENEK